MRMDEQDEEQEHEEYKQKHQPLNKASRRRSSMASSSSSSSSRMPDPRSISWSLAPPSPSERCAPEIRRHRRAEEQNGVGRG